MAGESEILNFFDIRIEHFPDRSARWLFQDKENVRGLVEIVAGELVELIDFSQLSQINRSFIPDNLREQESDLVFSVPLQSEEEVEVMAQTMAEHLIERGIEQGETRAKQEILLKLIRFQFDSVPESITNQITQIQSHSRLDSLFERVLTAQTLDEIDWQNRDS